MTTYADLAQAVVDELNAGTFSQEFVATRHYTLDFAAADTDELIVAVVATAQRDLLQDRRSARKEIDLDIGIIKRVADPTLVAVDALSDLVDEIKTKFFMKQFASPASVCIASKNEPLYDPVKLGKEKQFVSVLTLTFVLIG